MKFLVTGAAGFIGFYTAKALFERGDEVVGIDSMNTYYDVTLKEARLAELMPYERFTFVKEDIGQKPALDQLFAEHRPRRVIHLAAQAGVR